MQYIYQLMVILGASFAGEVLNGLLPLPVPASVYGLALLFTALMTGIVKLENVEKTGSFLIATMSVYFISPSVSLMTVIARYMDSLPAVIAACLASTALVMVVTGKVAGLLIRPEEEKDSQRSGSQWDHLPYIT